ncbi:MAG: 1-acyl-sn-glycerol-3-phosphate acyltransferase [Bdellovibrionota bacterium]
MLSRFNLLIEWLFRRLLRRVNVSQRFISTYGECLEKGNVFLVARNRSYFEGLATNYLLREFGLPLPAFPSNLRLVRFSPLKVQLGLVLNWILRKLRLARAHPHYRERLLTSLRLGENGYIFVKRGRSILRDFFQGNDPFVILLEEARNTSKPIYLLPIHFVLDSTPDRTKPDLAERLLGSAGEPGLLRRAWQVVLAFGTSTLQNASPVHLQEFLAANEGVPDKVLVRKLKLTLLQEFAAERKVHVGPKLMPRLELQAELLRNPGLSEFIVAEAERERVSKDVILQRASDIIDGMASDLKLYTALLVKHTSQLGYGQTYDGGLDIDREGLERVRNAMKQGPVLLLPNHTSHVDYLLISCLFYDERLALPQIMAGDNLAFWPLGYIFRGSGAFFIRRSFRDDRLYTKIFETYIDYLLAEGFPIEFFVEGTRSRNGRMRPPQFGMLSRIVASFGNGSCEKLAIVPIGIDYDRVVEEGTYRKELLGGKKEKEGLLALLKLPAALRMKRGRMYIRFGKPMDMAEYCVGVGLDPKKEEHRRELTQRLAWDILGRIQEERTVTVTSLAAAAILSEPYRPIPYYRIEARAELLRALAVRRGSPLGMGIGKDDSLHARQEAYRTVLERLALSKVISVSRQGNESLYTLAHGQYPVLDYYRNALANPLSDSALAAFLAWRKVEGRGERLDPSAIEGPFEFLSSLLSREIVGKRRGLADGLGALVEMDCLRDGSGTFELFDAERLAGVASIVRPLVECYYAMASSLGECEGEERILRNDLLPRFREKLTELHGKGKAVNREALTTAICDRAVELFLERGILEEDKVNAGKKNAIYLARDPRTAADIASRIDAVL